MPKPDRGTKQHIIEVAYDLFYKGGFARASVDAISESAGITKRTFYYHFESKQALLGAVLGKQHELAFARIQGWAPRVTGDPSTLVEKLFSEFATWSGKAGWRGSGFTRAAMEFAGSPGHPARLAARRHKAAVEAWLAEQFAQGGVKAPPRLARQVMLLMEGCQSLVLIHGEADYAKAASEAARVLVGKHVLGRKK